jgi:hypothetical protein
MKLHQLSLFLENRPGQLTEPCRLLAGQGINICTLALADTERFGILRMIVSDWQKAAAVLNEAGYVANATEVVAVEVADRPGGLAGILELLDDSGVNIEYMYAFTFRHGHEAVLVFRFDNPDRAIEALKAAGRDVLDAVSLFSKPQP